MVSGISGEQQPWDQELNMEKGLRDGIWRIVSRGVSPFMSAPQGSLDCSLELGRVEGGLEDMPCSVSVEMQKQMAHADTGGLRE